MLGSRGGKGGRAHSRGGSWQIFSMLSAQSAAQAGRAFAVEGETVALLEGRTKVSEEEVTRGV